MDNLRDNEAQTHVPVPMSVSGGFGRPIQNSVVVALSAIIGILVLTLVSLLVYFSIQLGRRSVAQEAVNCYSEKQSEYSAGITDLLAGAVAGDEKAQVDALVMLRKVDFEECRKDH